MGNSYNKGNSDLVNTGFEDDFDFMLGSLFRVEEAQEAKEDDPLTSIPVCDESSSAGLLYLLISELDCPVCLQPMLGQEVLPHLKVLHHQVD